MQDRRYRSLRKPDSCNHVILVRRFLAELEKFISMLSAEESFLLVIPRRTFPLKRKPPIETLQRGIIISSCVGFTCTIHRRAKNSTLTVMVRCGKKIEKRTWFFCRGVAQMYDSNRLHEERAANVLPRHKPVHETCGVDAGM
jgi:hypothetical protein